MKKKRQQVCNCTVYREGWEKRRASKQVRVRGGTESKHEDKMKEEKIGSKKEWKHWRVKQKKNESKNNFSFFFFIPFPCIFPSCPFLPPLFSYLSSFIFRPFSLLSSPFPSFYFSHFFSSTLLFLSSSQFFSLITFLSFLFNSYLFLFSLLSGTYLASWMLMYFIGLICTRSNLKLHRGFSRNLFSF